MWSQPDAIEEIIVVSDMGEAWSPNTPPEITAPMRRAMSRFNVPPKAKAIGIIIENVPQLVPVAKAVILATMKMRKGTNIRGILPWRMWARYWAVPRSEMTLPIKRAKTNIIVTGNISAIPS
jgi:hypothetical protein